MFTITNLSVSVDEKPILSDITLSLAPGSVHLIMGPNGSGKSTLSTTLMGHPRYTVTKGAIALNGIDCTGLSADKRARLGLFLAFQHPLEIPGLSIFSFLKEAKAAITGTQVGVKEFEQLLHEKMALLKLDHSFAARGVNEGFSGGEKKRFEILQMLILNPTVAILDEIDSGLDVDALKIVMEGIAHVRAVNPHLRLLIITHYPHLLNYITVDAVHLLMQGRITQSADSSLAYAIEKRGYDAVTL